MLGMLLHDQDAPLVQPVHLAFEIGTRPAALQHEQQAQEILVQYRNVCGIDIELRREIDKARRLR